jgi:threonine dehydrogenase-like Zn-dependent dehydrogenase
MNAISGNFKALWFVAPGQVEWREEPVPNPGAGDLRVRALFSGISRGTESLVFHGRIPSSEYGRMRAPFQAVQFPFPVTYGYAAVGEVEDGPADLAGRAVFALHPHQTVYILPRDSVIALPQGLPPARAVLAANMETALNAIWDGGAAPASRIAVVGAGVVGSLVAYLAGRLPGAEVTLVDIQPARARVAAALGVSFAEPGAAPSDCDLVFHASGTAEGLDTALAAAGDEAMVVEMSWYGDRDVPVALGRGFHSRRLRLISSQVGKVANSQRSRWNHGRRLSAALALLQDPALDVLLEPACRFTDLPDRLPAIFKPGSGTLCQLVAY